MISLTEKLHMFVNTHAHHMVAEQMSLTDMFSYVEERIVLHLTMITG